jgi:hypothetical protein
MTGTWECVLDIVENGNSLTLEQIAGLLATTRERVRQVQEIAFDKLRESEGLELLAADSHDHYESLDASHYGPQGLSLETGRRSLARTWAKPPADEEEDEEPSTVVEYSYDEREDTFLSCPLDSDHLSKHETLI